MKKIFFCGGGSAGHVIPNIAIMRDLKDRYELGYMGTDGIEYRLVRSEGIRYFTFCAPKFERGKIIANLSLPCRLKESVSEAKEILMREKPCLVFCKGGYVSLPPALAAKKLGIPVIAHESDLTPGLANKIISRFAKVTLTSFPETAEMFKRGRFSGPPVRKDALRCSRARAKQKFKMDERPVILVFGGGSGSLKINAAVRDAAKELCKTYNILHLCGKGNKIDAHIDGYTQLEFASDMGEIYGCADYAVARAGSNSAFELIINQIPALFVPLENSSTRGDQPKNAAYFEKRGLCKVLRESQLCPETLEKALNELVKDGDIKRNLAGYGMDCGNSRIIFEIEKTAIYSK